MSRAAIPQHRYHGSIAAAAAMIESAINAEDVIVFSYPSSEDGQPKRRVFSPWLLERDGEIVKGWDHGADGIRRYSIGTIFGHTIDVDLSEEWVRPL